MATFSPSNFTVAIPNMPSPSSDDTMLLLLNVPLYSHSPEILFSCEAAEILRTIWENLSNISSE